MTHSDPTAEGAPSAGPDLPCFAEPWHAQLFAVTLQLHENGCFTWPDWAARFGANLKQHGLTRSLDGSNDYFGVWLDTLEQLLADLGLADASALQRLKRAWETAYLSTPHGQPVHL